MLFKKKKKKPVEQRNEARVQFREASYFKTSDNSNSAKVSECLCRDISPGGISFTTGNTRLLPDTEVNILYKIGMKYRNDKIVVKHAKKETGRWRFGGQFLIADTYRNRLIENLYNKILKEEE